MAHSDLEQRIAAFAARGDVDAAIDFARPLGADAMTLAARTFAAHARWPGALRLWDQAPPTSPVDRVQRAIALCGVGRVDEGLAEAEVADALDPSGEAAIGRAKLLLAIGRLDDAISVVRVALTGGTDLHASDHPWVIERTGLGRAVLNRALAAPEEGGRSAQELVRWAPTDQHAWAAAAVAAARRGDESALLDAAVEVFVHPPLDAASGAAVAAVGTLDVARQAFAVARQALQGGHRDAARALYELAIQVFSRLKAPIEEAASWFELSGVWLAHHPIDAAKAMHRAAELREQGGDAVGAVSARVGEAIALLDARQTDAAARIVDAIVADPRGNQLALGLALAVQARIALARGDLGTAKASLSASEAAWAGLRVGGDASAYVAGLRSEQHRLEGNLAAARAARSSAIEHSRAAGPIEVLAEHLVAMSGLALADGDAGAAARAAAEADNLWQRTPDPHDPRRRAALEAWIAANRTLGAPTDEQEAHLRRL